MKRILGLCLATVMMMSMAVGCSKPAEEPQEEAKGYEKIVVGLDDTFAPMGFLDDNGELTGFDVDLMNAVSEEMDIPFELLPIDWSMKETELEQGNIDLIWNGYTITDERKEKVAFTQPYLKNKQIVVTMADSTVETLADLADKTVAAQAESSAVDAIEAKADVKDSFKELITYETNDQCLRDLEAGRTDAVVADEVLLRYYISLKGEENYKVLAEDFGDEEYGIGARKDETALVDQVNAALTALKENGKGAEISTKWFGSDIMQ